MKKQSLEDLLFKKKPLQILLSLLSGPKYITQIARKVNSPYPHVYKILKSFERTGIINLEKSGRIRVVSLTKKGENILEKLKEFLKIIE